MSKEGGVYSIPCKVNGLPLKFIFDTGASDVTISLTEAIFMLKNGYLDKDDIGDKVYFGLANGNIARGTKLNLKEIEFAGFKLMNVQASIINELNAPLLLGQSAIEKLGQIQLNGNELTILNGGKEKFDFSNSKVDVKQKENTLDTDLDNWKETNLVSGNVSLCENIISQYDYDIDNELLVNVGSNTDVVIKLMKKEANKEICIRVVYIRSKDSYSIKNIPTGLYFLKIAYGNDYRQKVEGKKCILKFMKKAMYEKRTDEFEFYIKRLPDEKRGDYIYKHWENPSYSLSLDVIQSLDEEENFKSNEISESEFNK